MSHYNMDTNFIVWSCGVNKKKRSGNQTFLFGQTGNPNYRNLMAEARKRPTWSRSQGCLAFPQRIGILLAQWRERKTHLLGAKMLLSLSLLHAGSSTYCHSFLLSDQLLRLGLRTILSHIVIKPTLA